MAEVSGLSVSPMAAVVFTKILNCGDACTDCAPESAQHTFAKGWAETMRGDRINRSPRGTQRG